MKFFDKQPTIKFASHRGAPEVSELTRIKLSREIKPDWLQNQRGSDFKFAQCPGMDDWLKSGYIIPAWTDIEIKANKAGTIIKLLNQASYQSPERMDDRFVKDIINLDSNVKFCAWKIPSPWAIFTKPGYSAHVLPALFHSPFLRDLFLYPGSVDYDSFTTVNVMFTPIRECHIKIPAGTPLLHIIPFKREDIDGVCSGSTQTERNKHVYGFPTRVTSAYRKFCHKKKRYTLKNI